MADYARIDILRGSTTLATLEEVIRGEVRYTLGRANTFNMVIANPDGSVISPGFIVQGDTANIYLGQDDDYSKVMSGIIYKIEMPENEIHFSGYDWTDFLVGPKATRRYEYQDYALILKDLLNTYCSQLDTDFILETGQILDGEYITRYNELIEVVEDILDTIGYRLIVATDKKVLIFPKEETPIILDSFKTDYSSDGSAWDNLDSNYWIRNTESFLMAHVATDHLYAKGIRKSCDIENLKVKSKIWWLGTGGTEKLIGSSLKGDEYENCCYGYLDFKDNKLLVGANSPGTLAFTTGGTATASSTEMPYGQFGPEFAFDGLMDGKLWISDPTGQGGGGLPAWLKYDLGAGTTKTATKLRFMPYYCISDVSAYVKDFELQASNDDVAWTTLTTGVGMNTQIWQDFYFENTTAYRYYRLYITSDYDPNADGGAVIEMELTESVPISSEIDISIAGQVWYPLELHLSDSVLTASVGTTQVSTTLAITPPGTLVSLDSDTYAYFDDVGIYSTAKHSLGEDDLYSYNITGDTSDIANRVIIIGGYETKYDGFDTTKTFDRWTIPGGSNWTVVDGYLKPTSDSYIFGGNQFWSYLDYKANPLYNASNTLDFFYRRTTSTGDHDDGFFARLATNTLSLVCATDGTIAAYTLTSPPSLGDPFSIRIKTDMNLHEVYLNDIRRIEAEDEHYPNGFIGIYASANSSINLVNCKSDKKIIASAQESTLFGYGIKEEVLVKSEIRDRGEALSRAALELALRKVRRTSGSIDIPGDNTYTIGDTVSLDLPNSITGSPTEYLILDVKQKWKEKSYITGLKIAEKITGIEEMIRGLRKETRSLSVRELEVTDLIGSVQDAVTLLTDQVSSTSTQITGTFRFDEARYAVSDYG